MEHLRALPVSFLEVRGNSQCPQDWRCKDYGLLLQNELMIWSKPFLLFLRFVCAGGVKKQMDLSLFSCLPFCKQVMYSCDGQVHANNCGIQKVLRKILMQGVFEKVAYGFL